MDYEDFNLIKQGGFESLTLRHLCGSLMVELFRPLGLE